MMRGTHGRAVWERLPDAIVSCIAEECDCTALRGLALTSKAQMAQCRPRMDVLRAAYLRIEENVKELGTRHWLTGACADDDFCRTYALVHRLFPPLSIDLTRGFITDAGAAALLSAVEHSLLRWKPIELSEGAGLDRRAFTDSETVHMNPNILKIELRNNNVTNVVPFVELISRDQRVYVGLGENKLLGSRANINAIELLPLEAVSRQGLSFFSSVGERVKLMVNGTPLDAIRPTPPPHPQHPATQEEYLLVLV